MRNLVIALFLLLTPMLVSAQPVWSDYFFLLTLRVNADATDASINPYPASVADGCIYNAFRVSVDHENVTSYGMPSYIDTLRDQMQESRAVRRDQMQDPGYVEGAPPPDSSYTMRVRYEVDPVSGYCFISDIEQLAGG